MKAKASLDHAVLQRLIIVSLGLLTYVVMLTSCSHSQPCSAYDKVEPVKVQTK